MVARSKSVLFISVNLANTLQILLFLLIQAKELPGIKLKKGIILMKEMLMKLNKGNVNCSTCTSTASCCCEGGDIKLRARVLKESLPCKELTFLPKFLKVDRKSVV